MIKQNIMYVKVIRMTEQSEEPSKLTIILTGTMTNFIMYIALCVYEQVKSERYSIIALQIILFISGIVLLSAVHWIANRACEVTVNKPCTLR